MKIIIDARLYKETGVGRYIRSLIKYLSCLDTENEYSLLLLPNDYLTYRPLNSKWKIIPTPAKWHSFKEQIIIPQLLRSEKPDLVHFPYFNVPIFYKGKFIVTIHDLTILNFATGKASTHCQLYYGIKLLGFKRALNHAVYDSIKIITVSNGVKNEIINKFKINPEKISVIYESGELEKDNSNSGIKLPPNYILYVGNAHPHKNIITLIDAFKIISAKDSKIKLLLIGKDDFFYKRIKEHIQNSNMAEKIIVSGPVNNSQLASYYKNARAFVFPSLSEGFGIPGLEAMSFGCPVIASDIKTFREIYSDAALFFNPNNKKDIAEKITYLLNNKKIAENLINSGYQRTKLFSWKKMAIETLDVYNNAYKL